MITPSLVLSSARELAAHNGKQSEETENLDVFGSFDPGLLEKWRTIALEAETSGIGTVSALDALDGPVPLKAVAHSSLVGSVRIRVAKRNTPTTFYFFSIEGLKDLLRDADRVLIARKVLVAVDFAPFATASCRFESWTGMVEDAPPENTSPIIAPRRFVKDLIGGKVPPAIGPFLLAGDIPAKSPVFDTWCAFAVKQLMLSLVNEVWTENGTDMVALSGPRSLRLKAELESIDTARTLGPATEAARWVYESGRDVDARHALLTYEFAREWPEGISWAQGFAERAPRALDAAKTAFQAYVLGISKDTLKSLSDLRKTLSEEVGKVSQQTRELLSTLWRDFIVAVTTLLARIALVLADKPAGDSIAVRAMLLGTAIFIGSSLILNLSSNKRFMKIAEENRGLWRSKLYGFLAPSDLRDLADTPLASTTNVYHKVKRWVTGLYIIVILALLLTAAWPPTTHRVEPPKIAPQPSTNVPKPTINQP